MFCFAGSVSTLNYAQQANGILNKQQHSSVKMSSSLPQATIDALSDQQSGNGGGAGGKGSGSGSNGISMADWNELELKLLYMEAQGEEAQVRASDVVFTGKLQ